MSVKDRNAKRCDNADWRSPKGESLTAKPERPGAIGMTTNPTEELVELKPCPFDGEPAKLSIGNTSAWVLCTKPGCGCEQTHDTAQQAIAAWNTRAALESTRNDERKLVEAAQRALNYIENTEGELGITLECGDALRTALADFQPTNGEA